MYVYKATVVPPHTWDMTRKRRVEEIHHMPSFKREFFIDNLLVRIHFIIVVMR